MSWVKIDDQFPEHPKLMAVGLEGQGLQIAALCYCARQLTDGFIPAAALPLLTGLGPKASTTWTERMVAAGLWEPIANGMANGWQIHDYLQYNPARKDVLEQRQRVSQERSKAGSKGAANRWQTDGPVPIPSPTQSPNTPSRPGARRGARKMGGDIADEILERTGLRNGGSA